MLDFHVKVEGALGAVVLSALGIRTLMSLGDFIVRSAEVSLSSADVPPVQAQVRLILLRFLLVNAGLTHFLREGLNISARFRLRCNIILFRVEWLLTL